MSDNHSSSPISGIAVFTIGALVGAGIALLYAPRSGRETRELLAQRSRDLSKFAGEAYDGAKEAVRGKKAEFTAAIVAGQHAMHDERDRQSQGG